MMNSLQDFDPRPWLPQLRRSGIFVVLKNKITSAPSGRHLPAFHRVIPLLNGALNLFWAGCYRYAAPNGAYSPTSTASTPLPGLRHRRQLGQRLRADRSRDDVVELVKSQAADGFKNVRGAGVAAIGGIVAALERLGGQ